MSFRVEVPTGKYTSVAKTMPNNLSEEKKELKVDNNEENIGDIEAPAPQEEKKVTYQSRTLPARTSGFITAHARGTMVGNRVYDMS